MPCRDDGQAAFYDGITIREQREKIDMLTRFLCHVLTKLEEEDKGLRVITDDCAAWWEQHKIADKARIARELEAATEEEARRLRRIAALEEEIAKLKGKP